MMNLWRAEWLKTRRRPSNLWTLGVMLFLTITIITVMTIIAASNGKGTEEYLMTSQMLKYPTVLTLPISLLTNLGLFVGIIFAANAVASEYSRDTWKMIIPRQGKRIPFLVVKLLMGLLCIGILMVAMLIIGQINGIIGALILGSDPFGGAGTLGGQLKMTIAPLMSISFYIVITLLAAAITRSTVGAIITSIVVNMVFGMIFGLSEVMASLRGVAKILPTTYMAILEQRWINNNNSDIAGALEAIFGNAIPSATTSVLVLSGYVAVLIAASFWIFSKRDMAGV